MMPPLPGSLSLLLALAITACQPAERLPATADSATGVASVTPVATPAPGSAPAATPVVTPPAGARVDTAARPVARAAAPVAPATGPRHLEIGGIDMTGIGHDVGRADAPVVVVEFSDFGCPYCGTFARETWPTIERDYVRTGKVFFKYLPFLAGFAHGRESARAAECAGEQGKFWEMNETLFATQDEWRKGSAIDAQMAAVAGALSLDSARFGACYADRHTETITARATDVANRIGVRVTPSFLVNERPLQGALGLAQFRKVLDAALLVAQTGH